MRNSISWRVIGIGSILGLLWIGGGLVQNSPLSPHSFSSAAYADDSAPAQPASNGPELDFTTVKVPHHADLQFERAKVPGGWILMVRQLNSSKVDGFTFCPDPKHVWDEASAEERAEHVAARAVAESAPPRIAAPWIEPSKAASTAIELFDANKDGKISGDELDKAPGLKAALKVMNTDKDKGVTADQIAARIKKWLDSRVGRMSLSCMILHNGKPLAGATVKFVPEKFLSKYLTETAEGKTNQTGMAMLTLPTEPGPDALPPGLPPGIYRVEITKDGEKIPAKYNTETVLGQEVSLDNIDMQMGIKFDLKY
jgi:hypothetical protein